MNSRLPFFTAALLLTLTGCADKETQAGSPDVADAGQAGVEVEGGDSAGRQPVPPDDVTNETSGEIGDAPAAPAQASVYVGSCDHELLALTPAERSALASAGFTQCATPFGVLLAADKEMPSSYVTQAAQVLAEILDQNMDGVVDDLGVQAAVADHQVAWLAMPMDPDVWEGSQLPALQGALGYDIVIPAWWLDVKDGGPDTHGRAVMVEEIHHFMTQFGYSEVYPQTFGVHDWSSVIAMETAAAQCDYWQHPENSCPDSPAESPGDCADPSCDVVEFYQQVAVLRAGMAPGWSGIGFPATAAALEERLSDTIKAVLDDPAYHQLKAPLTFAYPLE
jgi:hypothetical protein